MSEDFRKKFLASNKGGVDDAAFWEHACVKLLLGDRYSIKKDIQDHCVSAYDTNRLSFSAFYDVLPNFPIKLCIDVRSKKAREITLAKLFSNVESRFFVEAYTSAVEHVDSSADAGKPVGVIVKWPYIDGGMLIHDYPTDPTSKGTRITVSADTVSLTIEPFAQFVRSLSDHNFEAI